MYIEKKSWKKISNKNQCSSPHLASALRYKPPGTYNTLPEAHFDEEVAITPGSFTCKEA